MNYKEFFGDDYLCLMVSYWRMMLEDLPNVGLLTRHKKSGDIQYMRVYSGKECVVTSECKLCSMEGQHLYKIYLQREQYERHISEFIQIWNKRTLRPMPGYSREYLLKLMNSDLSSRNMDFNNSLIEESAIKKYGEENHHDIYRGTKMRSRVEMVVASVLDSLELDYKYEPGLRLDEYIKYTDYFVAVPIVNRCFPCEVAGELDKMSYYSKFQSDLSRYISDGYLINRNLLVIGMTDKIQLNTDLIARNIADFVNNLVYEALHGYSDGSKSSMVFMGNYDAHDDLGITRFPVDF